MSVLQNGFDNFKPTEQVEKQTIAAKKLDASDLFECHCCVIMILSY